MVNLRAFINASPYHFPFRFVTAVSSIESRDGDVLVCPAGVTLTVECTTASWGLRNFTNFTSPSRRDPFCNCVEDPLSERGDLLPLLQVSTVPHDEISLVGERGGEGRAVARIPSIDHPLMDSTDGVLVSSVGSQNLSCL